VMDPTGATDGHSANNAAITFGPASATWGTITHIGIFDASSTGNMLFHGALETSKTIASGDSMQVATGELDITFS